MSCFIQKIWDKLKNLYDKRALYYLYFVGLILMIFGSFYAKQELLVLGILTIFIPALADSYQIAKIFIDNKIIRFIITFIPPSCVIYGIAESLSKEHITTITHTIPDTYTTTIYFFTLFYTFFISIFLFVLLLICLFFIYMLKDIILSVPSSETTLNVLSKANKYLVKKFGFKNIIHMECFLFIGSIAISILISTIASQISFYFYKYAPIIIHYTSYYENNTICSKIDKKYYIKTLGDNQVSISPFIGKMNDDIMGRHNEYTHTFLFLAYKENEEIGQNFITRQCN